MPAGDDALQRYSVLPSACRLLSTWYGIQGASLRGRPMSPATLAQEGRVHHIMRSGQRSMIGYSFFFMIAVANWRLDKAKSPAAMLQEKTGRTPRTLRDGSARYTRSHAVRTYIHTYPRWWYLFPSFDMLAVCKKENAQHGTAAPQKQQKYNRKIWKERKKPRPLM